MAAAWSAYHGVWLAVLACLPLAAAVVLVRRRKLAARPGAGRPDATRANAVRRDTTLAALAEVGAAYGTLPWLAMTLTPDPAASSRVNLVPLHDLATLLTAPPGVVVVQLVGNLLVFAAAGFLLPIRFAALRSLPRMLVLGAAGSTAIELTQYLADLGRVSSVDDVLVNAVGAMLAALASRPLWRRRDTTLVHRS